MFLAAHWWEGAVDVAVGITAVLTALVLISGLKPVRWLWRRIVAEPLTNWIVKTVERIVHVSLEPIRHELQHNNGTSIKDAVQRIEERQVRMENRVNGIEDRLFTEDPDSMDTDA